MDLNNQNKWHTYSINRGIKKMRKIGICITKGGVGKTTTAVNLAAGIAKLGHKVLLIDTDTQGQAGAMLGKTGEFTLADFVLKNSSRTSKTRSTQYFGKNWI